MDRSSVGAPSGAPCLYSSHSAQCAYAYLLFNMRPARTSEPLGTSGAAVPLLLFAVASFAWVVRPLLSYYVFMLYLIMHALCAQPARASCARFATHAMHATYAMRAGHASLAMHAMRAIHAVQAL